MTPELPFSQACENNKDPILSVIQPFFSSADKVLEIGSGTGQHAVYFAENMPKMNWQPSDQTAYLAGVRARVEQADLKNLLPPLELNVRDEWPIGEVSGMFTANTMHIMSWDEVVLFFEGVGRHLKRGGVLCIYGPFNYFGTFSSESNAAFDVHLKGQDPKMGIRDFEEIVALANRLGLIFVSDSPMPANNRILTFTRR